MKRTVLILVLIINIEAANAQVRPYAPELFSEKISGAVIGFGSAGKTIYFVREDTIAKKLFLFEAVRERDKWNHEKVLPFSGVYNDVGGRLTPDGNELYFTSDRPGGSQRESDSWNIWRVSKKGDVWGVPEPLTEINGNEECCAVPLEDEDIIFTASRPGQEWEILRWDNHSEQRLPALTYPQGWQWPSFYDRKERILFFNSMKRPDSKGMDDIYVARYSKGVWLNIQNVEAINSSIYEDGALLSPDRKLLIFCRHDRGDTPSRVMCIPWNQVRKTLL